MFEMLQIMPALFIWGMAVYTIEEFFVFTGQLMQFKVSSDSINA